jgi:hypothetical protein
MGRDMSDTRLEQGFGFDAATLTLNREGRLTDAQAAKVAKTARVVKRSRRTAIWVFGLISLAFLAFVVMVDPAEVGPARPMMFGLSAGLGFITLGIWGQTRRHLAKLTSGRVMTMEGQVRLSRKTVPNLGTAFCVTLGGRRFQLEDADQFAALVEGESYRFHMIPNGRVPIILSVERL